MRLIDRGLTESIYQRLTEGEGDDFIIYIPTRKKPKYVTGPSTFSNDKKKAIKFPTEDEARKYKEENNIEKGIVSR